MHLTVDRPLSPGRAMLLGLVFITPGFLFLAANVLNDAGISFLYGPVDAVFVRSPLNPLSPVLFLGGALAAILVNLLAVARLELHWEGHELTGSGSLALRATNLAVLTTASLVLAAFLAYAFVENFKIVPTHLG